MKCKKHPKYKAEREPKVDCLQCWKMYGIFQHAAFVLLKELVGGAPNA